MLALAVSNNYSTAVVLPVLVVYSRHNYYDQQCQFKEEQTLLVHYTHIRSSYAIHVNAVVCLVCVWLYAFCVKIIVYVSDLWCNELHLSLNSSSFTFLPLPSPFLSFFLSHYLNQNVRMQACIFDVAEVFIIQTISEEGNYIIKLNCSCDTLPCLDQNECLFKRRGMKVLNSLILQTNTILRYNNERRVQFFKRSIVFEEIIIFICHISVLEITSFYSKSC